MFKAWEALGRSKVNIYKNLVSLSPLTYFYGDYISNDILILASFKHSVKWSTVGKRESIKGGRSAMRVNQRTTITKSHFNIPGSGVPFG